MPGACLWFPWKILDVFGVPKSTARETSRSGLGGSRTAGRETPGGQMEEGDHVLGAPQRLVGPKGVPYPLARG